VFDPVDLTSSIAEYTPKPMNSLLISPKIMKQWETFSLPELLTGSLELGRKEYVPNILSDFV
jgi:hypothetical protein